MPDTLAVLAGVLAALFGVLVQLTKKGSAANWIPLATACSLVGVGFGFGALVPATALFVYGAHQRPVWGLLGAACIAASLPGGPWIWALAPMVLLIAPALHRLGSPASWALLTASAMACYTAVPDTEEITTVAVAAVSSAPWVMRKPSSPVGPAALVALMIWACAHGAVGRPASFVVAPATLAGVGILAWVCPSSRFAWRSVAGAVLACAHFLLCILICRTAGLERSASAAAFTAATWVLFGGAGLALLGAVLQQGSRTSEP